MRRDQRKAEKGEKWREKTNISAGPMENNDSGVLKGHCIEFAVV